MKKFLFFLFLALILPIKIFAGSTQPTIMVVPFTKEGEDIRQVLENDVNKRMVLNAIREGFDQENFNTIDFLALLKSHSRDEFISDADGQTVDEKAELIKQSGAEIYVEAEIKCVVSQSGNSCDVILTAYKTATGESLANAHGNSGQYYTDDFGRLGAIATKRLMTGFLQTMQNKFDQISVDGNAIRLSIGFGASGFNADTPCGSGMPFSDELEEWITNNSNNGNYHIQGVTTNKIVYDRVHIPTQDKNGNPYTTSKFSAALYKYFLSLGLTVQRTVEGNSLNFTLDQ